MKKGVATFVIAITIGALAMVVLILVIQRTSMFVIPSDSEESPYEDEILPPSGRQDDNGLTELSCTDAGGTWNPCGSACRMDPDAICIELCVEYCECKTDSQCPSGYSCSDFVDNVGVCL